MRRVRYCHNHCVGFPSLNRQQSLICSPSDNRYTLYANGAEIGSGIAFESTGGTAQAYTIGLNPDIDNVIAINATNTGGPAGLLAAIQVDYLDGTSETFVTDASWKTLQTPTASGFESPSLDDSAWVSANVEGPVGTAPWGAVPLPPALDLTQSNWIWTNESSNAAINAPIGNRAFRKTIDSSCGRKAVCAKVVLTTYVEFKHGLISKILTRITVGITATLSMLTGKTLAQGTITPPLKPTPCSN